MQQHILTDLERLTDEDVKRLDQQQRLYWIRIYTLVAECGAPLDLAIKAIQQADKEHTS